MASRNTPGVALITGAASGIGKDVAISFAENGAVGVIFADLNKTGADDAAQEAKKYATNPNFKTLALEVDVTNAASVQAMVDAAVKEVLRIDYFVHCAGVTGGSSPVPTVDIDRFDKTLNVNLRGTLLCNSAISRAMLTQERRIFKSRYGERDIGRGAIVNLGSMMSFGVLPGAVAYGASKHGVIAVMKASATELGPQGIRVNAVCPSWVDTPMVQADIEKSEKFANLVKRMVPSGRLAMPDEVGDAIVFMCSPAASYMNGISLIIDDGISLGTRITTMGV